MPGGGAEIFAPQTRDAIIKGKADADQWLAVMREAHRQGIPTNATMLYGHIESVEDRGDHLLPLCQPPDETGRRMATPASTQDRKSTPPNSRPNLNSASLLFL